MQLPVVPSLKYRRAKARILAYKAQGRAPLMRDLAYTDRLDELYAMHFCGSLGISLFGAYFFWAVHRLQTQRAGFAPWRKMLVLSPLYSEAAAKVNKLRNRQKHFTAATLALSVLGCLVGSIHLCLANQGLLFGALPFEQQLEEELF